MVWVWVMFRLCKCCGQRGTWPKDFWFAQRIRPKDHGKRGSCSCVSLMASQYHHPEHFWSCMLLYCCGLSNISTNSCWPKHGNPGALSAWHSFASCWDAFDWSLSHDSNFTAEKSKINCCKCFQEVHEPRIRHYCSIHNWHISLQLQDLFFDESRGTTHHPIEKSWLQNCVANTSAATVQFRCLQASSKAVVPQHVHTKAKMLASRKGKSW